jgi:hypothetical protein
MNILLASTDAVEVVSTAAAALNGVSVLCISLATFFLVYKIVKMVNRMDGMK